MTTDVNDLQITVFFVGFAVLAKVVMKSSLFKATGLKGAISQKTEFFLLFCFTQIIVSFFSFHLKELYEENSYEIMLMQNACKLRDTYISDHSSRYVKTYVQIKLLLFNSVYTKQQYWIGNKSHVS